MSYTPRYAHRRHPGRRKYQTKLQITYLFFDFSLFHVRVMTNRRAHCNKGVGDVACRDRSEFKNRTDDGPTNPFYYPTNPFYYYTRL